MIEFVQACGIASAAAFAALSLFVPRWRLSPRLALAGAAPVAFAAVLWVLSSAFDNRDA